MLIGIMSDSHNNINNIKKALSVMRKRNVSAIIHCGDICRPSAFRIIVKEGLPIYCSFGNMDNPKLLKDEFSSYENVLFSYAGKIDIGGKRISFTHFPHLAESMALEGNSDIIFYGHTHEKKKTLLNNTLLVNPGEILGRSHIPSFALFDTNQSVLEFVELE